MLTRDVLKSYLLEMPRGHIFDLTYKLFADVFPPGEPDQDARLRALTFAKANGCVIENRAGNREVLFLKPGLGPAVEI